MTLVLLAVGLLATAAGFVLIGFGIPNNAFGLGNTLIMAGAISVATGLVLIALALILGQLKRIAEALRGAALPRTARAAESVEVTSKPVTRVAPAPVPEPELTVPEPLRMPEPRAPEPRFPATASEPAAAPSQAPSPPPGPLDWLRSKSKPSTMSPPPAPMAPSVEPPMVEVTDEAPLSPRSPQRPAMPPIVEPAPAHEPKAWSPGRDTGPLEPRLAPAPRVEQPMPRAMPQVEPPKEKERFDLVWPDRAASGSAPASEPKVEAKREPVLDMPMPPIPARPRDNSRPAAEKRMPEILRKAAERGPAILKSGVIDGMPYTLYADGSIEAQLPQGMVKFASVDALRAHLEK